MTSKLCVIFFGGHYSDYRDFKQDLLRHVKGTKKNDISRADLDIDIAVC